MKKACAKEALKYIKEGMTIGLGGGSTISYLVELLEESRMQVKVVTPSYHTAQLCVEHRLAVVPAWSVSRVDVAFDGCDEVDYQLNALKSGGGIHTKEKIIASMAGQYILLADESKVVPRLEFRHPVVLEVVPEAKSYVEEQVEALGGRPAMRSGKEKDGYTVSDHGLFLMDVSFDSVHDAGELHQKLKLLPGVLDTSLFCGIVSGVLVAGPEGIRLMSRVSHVSFVPART